MESTATRLIPSDYTQSKFMRPVLGNCNGNDIFRLRRQCAIGIHRTYHQNGDEHPCLRSRAPWSQCKTCRKNRRRAEYQPARAASQCRQALASDDSRKGRESRQAVHIAQYRATVRSEPRSGIYSEMKALSCEHHTLPGPDGAAEWARILFVWTSHPAGATSCDTTFWLTPTTPNG